MATPESKAKDKVKRLIGQVAAERGIKYYLRSNTAGGVGFANGTPDMTLFWRVGNNAIPIELEIKAGGGKVNRIQVDALKQSMSAGTRRRRNGEPTPLQLAVLTECLSAGAHGFVIWGDHIPDLEFLEKFLRRVDYDTPITGKFEKSGTTGTV